MKKLVLLVAVIATSTLGGCTADKNNEPAQTEIVNPVGGEEESDSNEEFEEDNEVVDSETADDYEDAA